VHLIYNLLHIKNGLEFILIDLITMKFRKFYHILIYREFILRLKINS